MVKLAVKLHLAGLLRLQVLTCVEDIIGNPLTIAHQSSRPIIVPLLLLKLVDLTTHWEVCRLSGQVRLVWLEVRWWVDLLGCA